MASLDRPESEELNQRGNDFVIDETEEVTPECREIGPVVTLTDDYTDGELSIHIHTRTRKVTPFKGRNYCTILQAAGFVLSKVSEPVGGIESDSTHLHESEMKIPVLVDVGEMVKERELVPFRIASVIRLQALDDCEYVRRYGSDLLRIKVPDRFGNGEHRVTPEVGVEKPGMCLREGIGEMVETGPEILKEVAQDETDMKRRFLADVERICLDGRFAVTIEDNFVRLRGLHELHQLGIERFEMVISPVTFRSDVIY